MPRWMAGNAGCHVSSAVCECFCRGRRTVALGHAEPVGCKVEITRTAYLLHRFALEGCLPAIYGSSLKASALGHGRLDRDCAHSTYVPVVVLLERWGLVHAFASFRKSAFIVCPVRGLPSKKHLWSDVAGLPVASPQHARATPENIIIVNRYKYKTSAPAWYLRILPMAQVGSAPSWQCSGLPMAASVHAFLVTAATFKLY